MLVRTWLMLVALAKLNINNNIRLMGHIGHKSRNWNDRSESRVWIMKILKGTAKTAIKTIGVRFLFAGHAHVLL